MADIINKEPHRQFDRSSADLRQRQREVVSRIFTSLGGVLEIAARRIPEEPPQPIFGLIAEIQALIAKLADAEDTTFIDIVKEATSLLQSLENCRRDLAGEDAVRSPDEFSSNNMTIRSGS